MKLSFVTKSKKNCSYLTVGANALPNLNYTCSCEAIVSTSEKRFTLSYACKLHLVVAQSKILYPSNVDIKHVVTTKNLS